MRACLPCLQRQETGSAPAAGAAAGTAEADQDEDSDVEIVAVKPGRRAAGCGISGGANLVDGKGPDHGSTSAEAAPGGASAMNGGRLEKPGDVQTAVMPVQREERDDGDDDGAEVITAYAGDRAGRAKRRADRLGKSRCE